MTPLAFLLAGLGGLAVWAALTGESPVTVLGQILRGDPTTPLDAAPAPGAAAPSAAPGVAPSGAADNPGGLAHPTGGAGSTGPAGVFGASRDGGARRHQGKDYSMPEGNPIFAVLPGVVTRADFSSSYGNVVYVDHADGWQSRYAHLRPGGISVSLGQQVARGQQVGLCGSTGNATGPHLHFEIRHDGTPLDPTAYGI